MDIKQVNDEFSVSTQITLEDVPALAQRGIKSLICNRPDGEAAARMQAPIVANNVLEDMGLATGIAHYNGYGSCPLTVERGKIVLAEFGFGGKLLPSFPQWAINGQKPSRLAWILKEKILPPIYWKAMLKGKEWMVDPEQTKTRTATG